MDNVDQDFLVSSETKTGAWRHKRIQVAPHEANKLKISVPHITVGHSTIDVRACFENGKLTAIELRRSK